MGTIRRLAWLVVADFGLVFGSPRAVAVELPPATGEANATCESDSSCSSHASCYSHSACSAPSSCPTCGLTWCLIGSPPSRNLWGSVEYLVWWPEGSQLPPLASTGPIGPGTTVLFGNERVGDDARSGVRATIGSWFDPSQTRGLMGRFFALGDRSVDFSSAGTPNVARPFIDMTPGSPAFGMENALIVNAPGGAVGDVSVAMSSDVQGGDLLFRWLRGTSDGWRIDFLAGYQTSRIDQDLTISHTFVDGGITIEGMDTFDARNEFHAGQIGLLMDRRDCWWTLEVLAKLGFGNMEQTVTISGVETRQPPQTVSNGALLALPTNIGRFTQNDFAVAPEFGVKLIRRLGHRMDFSIGYSFLYWSRVAQVGDQIDRAVNASQTSGGNLVGEPRPAFAFNNSGFWVQGINFGLHSRF